MTATQGLKIYGILRALFGVAKDAREVATIEQVVDEKVTAKLQPFESAFRKDPGSLRADFSKQLAAEIGALRVDMKAQKSGIIKWMFIFSIGQPGATIAVLTLFLKK